MDDFKVSQSVEELDSPDQITEEESTSIGTMREIGVPGQSMAVKILKPGISDIRLLYIKPPQGSGE